MSISPSDIFSSPTGGSLMDHVRPDATTSSPEAGRFVIGIDLGGTKMLGAIAATGGHPLAERELATTGRSPVSQIYDLVHALLAEISAGASSLGQVVIGVPGVVDSRGAVSLSPHVVFPQGESFAQAVSEALGVPAFADNDANVAAYGEYSRRRDAPAADVVLVTIGTGVGMGIVVNGKIIRGAHGAAGEIGSMPFSAPPQLAHVRHYEGVVSTSGLRNIYRGAGGRLDSVRDIFDAADRGEAIAATAVEHFLDDVASGLGVVVSLLDPGLIVLSGGIGARPGVADRVAQRLGGLVPTPCSVVASQLGARAGLVGALALADRLVKAQQDAAA